MLFKNSLNSSLKKNSQATSLNPIHLPQINRTGIAIFKIA